jgi:hypothetical protein
MFTLFLKTLAQFAMIDPQLSALRALRGKKNTTSKKPVTLRFI